MLTCRRNECRCLANSANSPSKKNAVIAVNMYMPITCTQIRSLFCFTFDIVHILKLFKVESALLDLKPILKNQKNV